MLTDIQIKDLAKKMDIPLVFCGFKDELKENKLQYNKSYIINLDDSIDDKTGEKNEGSHWIAAQVNKYPNGKTEGIFFDSYGMPPAEDIKSFFGKGIHLPYNTRDIQSLMNSACGYYCLAFLHYINSAQSRSKDFYTDIEDFLDMFEDLNKSKNWKANEYFLKHFFVSKDPKLRREIEVIANPKTILSEDEKPNEVRMDCEVKYV